MTNLRATQTGSGWDVDDTKSGPVSAELDGNGRPTGRMLTDDGQVVGGGGSMIERAAARYKAKYQAGVSQLIATGDSYGIEESGGNGYTDLMAAAFASDFRCSNFAEGSSTTARYTKNTRHNGSNTALTAHRLRVERDWLIYGMVGFNDLRGGPYTIGGTLNAGCGPSGEAMRSYRKRLMYMVSHFCIPDANKVRALEFDGSGAYALNPAVTYTGTWTVGNAGIGADQVASTTTGTSAAEMTTPAGDLVVVAYLNRLGAASPGVTIEIDGVDYGEMSNAATYDAAFAPTCAIYQVPYAESHTVKLSRNGVSMSWEWVACVDTSTDFGATMIWAPPSQLLDAASTGWSSGNTLNGIAANSITGPSADLRGEGGRLRFESVQHETMRELYELGFNVVPVDINVGFDPNTMMDADTVHRNADGHKAMFRPFEWAVRRLIR